MPDTLHDIDATLAHLSTVIAALRKRQADHGLDQLEEDRLRMARRRVDHLLEARTRLVAG